MLNIWNQRFCDPGRRLIRLSLGRLAAYWNPEAVSRSTIRMPWSATTMEQSAEFQQLMKSRKLCPI
jgi:hypothetical protein